MLVKEIMHEKPNEISKAWRIIAIREGLTWRLIHITIFISKQTIKGEND